MPISTGALLQSPSSLIPASIRPHSCIRQDINLTSAGILYPTILDIRFPPAEDQIHAHWRFAECPVGVNFIANGREFHLQWA